MKRPIILAKKEDKDDSRDGKSGTSDKPKILLKVKEKEVPAQPVQISIAARPVTESHAEGKPHNNATVVVQKESKDVGVTQPVETVPAIVSMKRAVPLVTDHFQLNLQAFEYLLETNSDFFVVGCVGTQGCGKSTILNLLATNEGFDDVLHHDGIFQTRSAKEFLFSSMPATEGIQMYITPDRNILLDCSPLLCNPYKKDCILNEIDDLKMIIFLLNVCHLLIVVEENGVNMNLLRLIQCAEKMKLDQEKEATAESYFPNVLFFVNNSLPRSFSSEVKGRVNQVHRSLLKESRLKISPGICFDDEKRTTGKDRPVNIFYFPHIDNESE